MQGPAFCPQEILYADELKIFLIEFKFGDWPDQLTFTNYLKRVQKLILFFFGINPDIFGKIRLICL